MLVLVLVIEGCYDTEPDTDNDNDYDYDYDYDYENGMPIDIA